MGALLLLSYLLPQLFITGLQPTNPYQKSFLAWQVNTNSGLKKLPVTMSFARNTANNWWQESLTKFGSPFLCALVGSHGLSHVNELMSFQSLHVSQ